MGRELDQNTAAMYAAETTENFRSIARVFARHSSYTLTGDDLVPVDLQQELADIGQFAEVAHGKLSPHFIWHNLGQLLQPGFPLHGYDALEGSVLLHSVRGTVAGLHGYIAHRPQTGQLVVAFSGTSSVGQTARNLRARLAAHPGGHGCAVHSGFWAMYQGVRARMRDELRRALAAHAVDEVVLTGHSLGAAMCYLFGLDITGASVDVAGAPSFVPCPLKLAVFGSPRVGNLALARHWRTVRAAHVGRGFPVSEYAVKGYNDGVPILPPYCLGYRHFSQSPMYFTRGNLYYIPAAEAEFSSFSIDADSARVQFLDHPLGGHNYYNRRDMEKLLRRMRWLGSQAPGGVDWERYREWLCEEREREGEVALARKQP